MADKLENSTSLAPPIPPADLCAAESVEDTIKSASKKKVRNRGTGAGGAKTTASGNAFENKTDYQSVLLDEGFTKTIMDKKTKFGYYLSKTFEDKTVIFVKEKGLKKYLKSNYDIEIHREPDEAYIIKYSDGKNVLKILEKKNQNTKGSVSDKLYAGPGYKKEYEIFMRGANFKVEFAFCISEFLKRDIESIKKKSEILNEILGDVGINIYHGDDSDYFEKLKEWIYSN